MVEQGGNFSFESDLNLPTEE